MKLSRRNLLHLTACAAGLPALPRAASALDYPSRPVRIIVGYAAGGAPDVLARLIGQWLSDRLGQPFVVENRPGANGSIAIDTVIKAAADGYTLLALALPDAVNATLYQNLNYNFVRDITPIAATSRDPDVMVVNPSLPAKTVPEFIDFAKANRGKIQHGVSRRWLIAAYGGRTVQIHDRDRDDACGLPWFGARANRPARRSGAGLLRPNFRVANLAYIRASKLRALAVTTAARAEALPDIPTVSDFVPGYEVSAWYGMGAPKNTPAEIVHGLNMEINAGLADPKLKARLADLGSSAFVVSAADFGKFITNEAEKWAKVVKFANIKPE